MNRAVYIGGFGSGYAIGMNVGDALAEWGNFNDVEVFTFSDAVRRTRELRRAVKEAFCVTHSAGMIPLIGTSPNSIAAFAAPVPTPVSELLRRTLPKMVRMHTVGLKDCEDKGNVFLYDVSSAVELALHPLSNVRNLGRIAQFDAIQAGIDAQTAGIPTQLLWSPRDDYFRPDCARVHDAVELGVTITRDRTAGHLHDELLLNPHSQLSNIRVGH